MTEEEFTNEEVYEAFWIYLAYFIGFVLLATGYVYGWQNWIYYGLFVFCIGILLNISSKVTRLYRMIMGATVYAEYIEDEVE